MNVGLTGTLWYLALSLSFSLPLMPFASVLSFLLLFYLLFTFFTFSDIDVI